MFLSIRNKSCKSFFNPKSSPLPLIAALYVTSPNQMVYDWAYGFKLSLFERLSILDFKSFVLLKVQQRFLKLIIKIMLFLMIRMIKLKFKKYGWQCDVVSDALQTR
jgi:hypothetical protein